MTGDLGWGQAKEEGWQSNVWRLLAAKRRNSAHLLFPIFAVYPVHHLFLVLSSLNTISGVQTIKLDRRRERKFTQGRSPKKLVLRIINPWRPHGKAVWKRRKLTINRRCVTSQKSEYLIHTAAGVWNHAQQLLGSSFLSVRPSVYQHRKIRLSLNGLSLNIMFYDFSKLGRENSSLIKITLRHTHTHTNTHIHIHLHIHTHTQTQTHTHTHKHTHTHTHTHTHMYTHKHTHIHTHTHTYIHTHTHTHTRSVGLLWTSDQTDAKTSTWQHTTQSAIPASERPQTHALNRSATGVDMNAYYRR